jgi:hypothetical protein
MTMTENEIKQRLAELEALIRDTTDRLPAHSTKPLIMMELLAYEDEYETLMADLQRLSQKKE